jgi:hypothetical protein
MAAVVVEEAHTEAGSVEVGRIRVAQDRPMDRVRQPATQQEAVQRVARRVVAVIGGIRSTPAARVHQPSPPVRTRHLQSTPPLRNASLETIIPGRNRRH